MVLRGAVTPVEIRAEEAVAAAAETEEAAAVGDAAVADAEVEKHLKFA
jgi:hypothetical protein